MGNPNKDSKNLTTSSAVIAQPDYEKVKPIISKEMQIAVEDDVKTMIKKIQSLLGYLKEQENKLYTPMQLQKLEKAVDALNFQVFDFIHGARFQYSFYFEETRRRKTNERETESKTLLINIFNAMADPVHKSDLLQQEISKAKFHKLKIIGSIFFGIVSLAVAIYGVATVNLGLVAIGTVGILGHMSFTYYMAQSNRLKLIGATVGNIADEKRDAYTR